MGSLRYLVVTIHDLLEVRYHWAPRDQPGRTEKLEFVAAGSYVAGTALFAIGSIFFFSAAKWQVGSAWSFLIGSLLFIAAACINALQIVQAQSVVTLQLMNLSAIAFVVGSVLFAGSHMPRAGNSRSPIP